MRVVSMNTPSPILPLPLDSQTQLVSDLLNVLIGVASSTFPLNQNVQFDVRPGVCISGASAESVSRLLGELAQYGTYYLRLSRFSLQSADKKGLVFQSRFSSWYRRCHVGTRNSPLLSLKLRYLSELCCVDGLLGAGQASFPVVSSLLFGIKLLSYLYNEAQNNCSNENYPVLLSLLKSSCAPYTRFVSDWVYNGLFRDVYGEFMIQVNEEYLNFRDKHFWSQGYTLISKDVEDCVPIFLKHIANDVYVCGKTINLLKICCPQHYICWSELPAPRIAVTFSLQEVEEIERECAVYRGRMERIAKHSAVSREEQALRTEKARQELINQVRESAVKTLESIRGRQVSLRLAEEAKKRERFEELKQHLEQEQEWRNAAKKKQEADDFSFTRELRDREKRLQALEEQLEERARKELIAQYSRLSEEAARRERRALWRVQRMRLDDARTQFFMVDRQKIQDIQNSGVESPPHGPNNAAFALIPEGINDLDPNSPNPDSQQVDKALEIIGSELPQAARPHWGPAVLPKWMQNQIGTEENLCQVEKGNPKPSPFGHPSKSNFVLGHYTPEEPQKTTVHGHQVLTGSSHKEPALQLAQDSEIRNLKSNPEANEDEGQSVTTVKVDVAQGPTVTTQDNGNNQSGGRPQLSLPDNGVESEGQKLQDQSSEAQNTAFDNLLPRQSLVSMGSVKAEELLSDARAPQPSTGIPGHSSDAHIKVGQYVPDVGVLAQPSKARSHSSDSHIKIGEHVSDVDTLPPACSLYGHSSDSHIKLGEHVSDVDTLPPACSLYGHSSDSHIKIGENATEFVPLVPVRNIHGHVSDAHILVGDLWSDIIAPVPPPSVYGHCSDAHIKVGENVSDVVALHPVPSIHGHSSDANIKLGEFVSNIPENQPRWSEHGHASDCILQPGCVVSGAEPPLQSLPGSSYGHSSDSALVIGCVVSGDEPKLSPLPGSEHGHSSDSHLGIGCVVSKTEPPPSQLPGSTYGHSSDSNLGVGCVVLGTEQPPAILPGSMYGHSSDSSLGLGCVVKEKDDGHPKKSMEEDESPSHAFGVKSSSVESYEEEYISALSSHYQVEHYEDFYNFLDLSPESQLLKQVTRGPWGLPMEPTLRRSTDTTSVQLSEMVSLPVLIKHSVTAPLITHVSLVNKAVVDYFFVEIGVEKHFEVLRHFLLMEDGEFAQSLSDRLFEKMVSGQTPGELLTPLVLNSILSKALQYSLHGDTPLAANFTFALRFLPETFHPHAPDSLNCLELRYKVDWPLNIIITDSCMNKYNRLFSFLLQLKHMVWSLRDVWFHLKRTALVKGAGRSVQFRQLQLYRHEMQHFVKVIQGYIANQILQVSWSEFTAKLATVNDLDAIHRTHADYLNRAIFRGLLTDKAAPVMNIIHSIFSLILKFRAQLIAQPWDNQQGEAVHPSFIAMQQSYNTFKYYSHFLFKVVTKLVNRGYQPHLEDFLLRINFNNYYKDS
uniref:Gamma-tubulin complex component 6 n=1 Tax=Oryzias sinensis TaxID=183150 RepID=A0A8C7ZX93_9TELE